MRISKLQLVGFRSYASKVLAFDEGVTVLLGDNAVGKTNVLEAIHLLATGESFRAKKIDEMVAWEEEVAHVAAKVKSQKSKVKPKEFIKKADDLYDENELRVVLTRGLVQGEKAQKRKYLINGVSKRKSSFVGRLKVVTFLPSDLSLISGSPSRRRKYVDTVLALVHPEYYRSLISYEKGLRRRNKLLDLIRDGESSRSSLLFWDQLLIREGNVISDARQAFFDFVNDGSRELRVVYDDSPISEKRLDQYKKEEVLAGYTLVGPHKDDFFVEAKNGSGRSRDLSTFGSRGEQRMAVLWLKMQEIAYIQKSVGERPVLLLDDIFSELDDEHDRQVWELVGKQQTIITTTDMSDVKNKKVAVVQLD
jgi:DNA replication and repair protein RecF